MTNIQLTKRGKAVLALTVLALATLGIYATTPEECKDFATSKTAKCAEYLR